MKVLIIAPDEGVRDALTEQFDVRGRASQSLSLIDELFSAGFPSDVGVVVSVLAQPHDTDTHYESVTRLAKVCSENSVPLMQLSSCRVFDGLEGGRHREDDDIMPVGTEGTFFASIEQQVRSECSQHIILRTGPLFGSKGNNLLTHLLSRLNEKTPLALSKKGKSCPLHLRDLARVISAIVDQMSCGCRSWGTYHYSSTEPVSSYQFAEAVLAVVSQYTDSTDHPLLLDPVDTVSIEWQQPLLNCEKLLFSFGIKQLPWRAFIAPTIKAVFSPTIKESVNE